ncbi:MAG: M23 family metallopeptidase [Bacteroidetes bacterium]|nr:M23 family metallopeptidase [Bacteroidota bacterium]
MFMDSVDSLLMFPSHDLYGNWDTSLIHPYLFDQHFTTDSTTIYLLDDWSCGFTVPCKGGVTSDFGWRRRRPHYGTDIDLETGDTVVAAFDGRVRIAKFNNGGYGNCVVIRHNNGLETVYAHLSKLLVEPGQEVASGTVIGLGGNTGHSFGSHLHFEVRFLGKPVDTGRFS